MIIWWGEVKQHFLKAAFLLLLPIEFLEKIESRNCKSLVTDGIKLAFIVPVSDCLPYHCLSFQSANLRRMFNPSRSQDLRLFTTTSSRQHLYIVCCWQRGAISSKRCPCYDSKLHPVERLHFLSYVKCRVYCPFRKHENVVKKPSWVSKKIA